jgi:hypothetical protein
MTVAARRHGAAVAMLIAVIAIGAGAVVGWLGWTRAHEQFYYSYLVAWLYWAGLSLGSLSLLLLHNLTGGKWGDSLRPHFRAAASALPIMGVLLLPIVVAPEKLYEWADPSHVAHDPILKHKQPYLNVAFFQVRAAIYFAVWLLLLILLAWQARTAPPAETPAERRFGRLSGQGLALHGLAVTFASFDWMMSLEPHWFSTIYGVIVFGSQGLAAMALAIVLTTASTWRTGKRLHADVLRAEIDAQHDRGKLLLGFVMFWAYVQFSQFLIIWYGNLPEEVVWYLKRTQGPWAATALAIVFLHFVLPFVLLLSRQWKRDPVRLGAIALLVLVMHWVATLWYIEPAVEHGRKSHVPWLDLGLTAAIGGVWWLCFCLLLPGMRRRHTSMLGEEHYNG